MSSGGRLTSPVPATEAGAGEAVLQSGTEEIHYRRTGRGRAVLLLATTSDVDVSSRAGRLAESCVVIQPRDLPDAPGWAAWLTTLVEGLGLETPDLIVDRETRPHLLEFAEMHPGWVGRIIDIETIDP